MAVVSMADGLIGERGAEAIVPLGIVSESVNGYTRTFHNGAARVADAYLALAPSRQTYWKCGSCGASESGERCSYCRSVRAA